MSLLGVLSATLGMAPLAGAPSSSLQIPDLGLFERNDGQFSPAARYLLKRPGLDYWITDEGITMNIYRNEMAPRGRHGQRDHRKDVQYGQVVKVSLVNSRVPEFSSTGETKTPFNVYKGSVAIQGQTRYAEVWRKGALPGVSTRYYQENGSPRYDYVLDSPARLSSIEMRYEGVKNLKVTRDGDLSYSTSVGEIREQGLTVYQNIDGKRHVLPASFRIGSSQKVGFSVQGANPNYPLTIDPQVMRDGTYFFANNTTDTETLVNGDVVISGDVYNPDLPVTSGAYRRTLSKYGDGFFARFKPRLNQLVYCTYFGGNDDEYEFHISRNPTAPNGSIYFGCQTYSTDLPVTSKAAFSASPKGFSPYFGAFSQDFGTLRYSSYFGSRNGDYFYDLTMSNSGNVYFVLGAYAGATKLPTYAVAEGSQTTFPVNGDYETYVGGLNSSLNSLFLGVYVGGEGYDEPKAIAMGTDGTVLVAGNTSSDSFRFGGKNLGGMKPFQGTKISSTTPFVARLRYTGEQLSATYFGGSSDSYVRSMTVNSVNEPVITGATDAPDLPFSGPMAMKYDYFESSYVAKLNPDLTAVTGGTYLTGYPVSVKLDDIDQVYVMGDTYQSEFPVVGDPLRGTVYESSSDVFLTRLSADFSKVMTNATIGGDAYEESRAFTIGAAPFRNVTLLANKFGEGGPVLSCSPSYPSYLKELPDYSSSFITTIGYSRDPYEARTSVTSIAGGKTTFVQVRLNLPAGKGGTPITFTSSDPSVLTFKDDVVLVPAGTDFFSNKIVTKAVSAAVDVTVTATGPDGISASTVISVKKA